MEVMLSFVCFFAGVGASEIVRAIYAWSNMPKEKEASHGMYLEVEELVRHDPGMVSIVYEFMSPDKKLMVNDITELNNIFYRRRLDRKLEEASDLSTEDGA